MSVHCLMEEELPRQQVEPLAIVVELKREMKEDVLQLVDAREVVRRCVAITHSADVSAVAWAERPSFVAVAVLQRLAEDPRQIERVVADVGVQKKAPVLVGDSGRCGEIDKVFVALGVAGLGPVDRRGQAAAPRCIVIGL